MLQNIYSLRSFRFLFSVLLSVCLLVLATGCTEEASLEATYTELGIPLEQYYPTGGIERCAWDVEVYNNALYVASGDYDVNKGPVSVWCYNIKNGIWENSAELPDEQIERFHIFDNKLYAPGCDPKESWDLGNYYICDKGEWTVMRNLPGGIHNFDLIKYDGKLFAGLGVSDGDSPIVMSTDEKEWTPVYLYKGDGLRRFYNADFIRVYDFFVLNDRLYAYFFLSSDSQWASEIYHYDGERFVYHSDMLAELYDTRHTYAHISQKVEFRGKQYFTNGSLFVSENMVTAEEVLLEDTVEVLDIRVIGSSLYALCNESIINENGDEEFIISLRRSKTGEEFTEMFYFNYPVRALSFTYRNGIFYFGMGYGSEAEKPYDKNGM
ncbi:MAG: hypothetical protein IKT44_00205, partial [Clostridia bacterium]|nr:hypothetical protein [Clostridia bacterium]